MLDLSQYDEKKPLDMHNLQFDMAAERLNLEHWIVEKIKKVREGACRALEADGLMQFVRKDGTGRRGL